MDEYEVRKDADDIVKALLSGKMYPIQIDKLRYDAVYAQLVARYSNLQPRVFLFQGQAVVQFSGISAATLIVASRRNLTRESFTADCVFRGSAQPLTRWPKALMLDMKLLKWYLIPICAFGIFLLALQSPDDLHSYFTLIAQVLAIVFTLYAVLRQSLTNAGEQDLPDQVLNTTHQSERVIGVTGIGSIILCLLGFLLTSPSIVGWDREHALDVESIHFQLFRWISVAIGVVLLTLLASFFRSIVFYYPDMNFGQTLLRIRDTWFKEQHLKASKSIREIKNDNQNS